jgi:hypothetical protein
MASQARNSTAMMMGIWRGSSRCIAVPQWLEQSAGTKSPSGGKQDTGDGCAVWDAGAGRERGKPRLP